MFRSSRGTRAVSATFTLLLAGAVGFAFADAARASDARLNDVRDRLQTVAQSVDRVGSLAELTKTIPLTGVQPASDQVLKLTTAVSDAINDIASTDVSGGTQALQTALENVGSGDSTWRYFVGCESGSSCDAPVRVGYLPPGANEGTATGLHLEVPVHVRAAVQTPLESAAQGLSGASGNVSLTAAYDLTLPIDVSFGSLTSNPTQAIAFNPAPTGQLSLSFGDSAASFTSRLGFTDLTGSLQVTSGSLSIPFSINDPDGAGGATLAELQATDIRDLVGFTSTPAQPFSATASLDSSLLPDNPDATLTIALPDLRTGDAAAVTVTPGGGFAGLTDFTNASPDKVFAGIAQFANTLLSIQASSDIRIPLLEKGLTSAAKFAEPFLGYIAANGVVCGTSADGPLSGGSSVPLQGVLLYCQSTAMVPREEVTGITWTPVGARVATSADGVTTSNTSGADAIGTIGASPNKRAVFVVEDPQGYSISASYTAGGSSFTTRMPPVTAQQMRVRLVEALNLSAVTGYDPATDLVGYDAARKTLTFRIVRELPSASLQSALDFGDKLRSIGLLGLDHAPTASISLTATGIRLDVTFGVFLGDVADINPTATYPADNPRGEADRFFLQVPASGPVVKMENLTATGNVNLTGRVGFLGVSVTGTSPSAFSVGKRDGFTEPVLAVTLDNVPNIPLQGGANIPRALQLRNLASYDLLTNLQTAVNLKAQAGLTVAARMPGATSDLASGRVDVTVPNALALAQNASTVDPDDPASLNPYITVTAGGNWNADLAGFAQIGGNANPEAMFALITGLLDQFLTTLSASSAAELDQPLPVVGVSPRALLTQVNDLKNTIRSLTGTDGTSLDCGPTVQNGRPAGDPASLADSDGLSCQLRTAKPPVPGSVRWSVGPNPVPPAPSDTPDADTTVGPAPTTVKQFASADLPGRKLFGTATTGTYAVHVRWADEDGNHLAVLPSAANPPTLQGLADALTTLLRLPTGAITATLGNVETASGDKRSLKLRLALGACTTDRQPRTTTFTDAADRCQGSDVTTAPVQLPLTFDLGTNGSLASIGTTTTLVGSYLARAVAHVAVPLDSATPTPLLMGDSGLALRVRADTAQANLSATLGPLTAELGKAVPTSLTPTPAGEVHAGLAFAVTRPTGDAGKGFAPADFIPAGGGSVSAAGTATCGGKAKDEAGAEYGDSLDGGFACAKVAASTGTTYLGEIGVKVGSGGVTISTPPNLGSLLAAQALDPTVLLRAVELLLGKVRESLDGTNKGVKLPIVGDALDGGARVAESLETFVNGLQAELEPLKASANVGALKTGIKTAVVDVLSGPNLLRKSDGDATAGGTGDVHVIAACRITPPPPGVPFVGACPDSASLIDLVDLRLRFDLGQGTVGAGGCTAGCATNAVPFDAGLDGLPLRVAGAIAPTAGWRVHLDFGIDRRNGPYLRINNNSSPQDSSGIDPTHAEPEVVAKAGVALAEGTGTCLGFDPATSPGMSTTLASYNSNRCLSGRLGPFDVNLRDATGGATAPDDLKQSGISFSATLDLQRSGTDRIGITDFPSTTVLFGLQGGGRINVRFRTGLADPSQSGGLPTLLGTLHLSSHFTISSDSGATPPAFSAHVGDMVIDTGTFVSQLLGPIAGDIKKVTSPLKPVIDTLQAPLPVLTQLAALVGQPPVTLLSLIQATTGADLQLVTSLLSLINLANNLPGENPAGFIPLSTGDPGGRNFEINTTAARSGGLTPDNAGQLVGTQFGTQATNFLGLMNPSVGSATDSRVPPLSGGDTRAATFGVKGLTFPLFSSASNIFTLLMGQDVTVVRYDAGTLEATAATSVSFGPFFIGPVPVTAFIGGSATVRGRFVVAYDTSGLRKVLAGASGSHLLDGVFFDDFDLAGNDVPEITLIGTVQAGAAVDIVVARAGIAGGITLTVDLNLADPNQDGKMRIEEVVAKLRNPFCLFDISGNLSAFLRFFVEINFFIDTVRKDFDIVNVELLNFSSSCSTAPPEPVLAAVSIVDGKRTLTLNIGNLGSARAFDSPVETNEVFTVRAAGNGAYDVTAFGFTKRYGSADEPIEVVKGDAAGGNDTITLLAGGTSGTTSTDAADRSQPIPFTAAAQLTGGAGNDKLTGGDGRNTIFGGDGNDVISGGPAADLLKGEEADDTIDGGPADDDIFGGVGNDTLNGGGGSDDINAGDGNDVVSGGPGVLDPAAPATHRDGGDVLIGGGDADTLSGVAGDDYMYGGYPVSANGASDPSEFGNDAAVDAACADSTAATHTRGDHATGGPGNDRVVGGPGDDELAGDEGNDRVCGQAGKDLLDGDAAPGAVSAVPAASGTTYDDTLDGGSERDLLRGGEGADKVFGRAGNDRVLGGSGDDSVVGGPGSDIVDGSDGRDIALGDEGTVAAGARTDREAMRLLVTPDGASTGTGTNRRSCTAVDSAGYVVGGTGDADCVSGGAGIDVVLGQGDADVLSGDDDGDQVEGGSGHDLLRGGRHDDVMLGDAEADDMFGDSGDDRMSGGDGADTMAGGIGDDDMRGNADTDRMTGDGGQDDMVGGSPLADAADAGDVMDGGEDVDFMTGDNATIVRATPATTDDATDGSIARTVTLLAGGDGDDEITGAAQNDRIWGQGGPDTIRGAEGKDLVFGNGGLDTIFGDSGGDHIVGGSATAASEDTRDVIDGGAHDDVVLGDNGTIAWATGAVTMPTSTSAGTFGGDTIAGGDGEDRLVGQLGDDGITGGAEADFILGDLGLLDPPTGAARDADGSPRYTVSLVQPDEGGVDTITGNGGNDRMFAGAANDVVSGNEGDDRLEGNGGRDRLFGESEALTLAEIAAGVLGTADDDILGGSSSVHPGALRFDEGETEVRGGPGVDVILGDNGEIVRRTSDDGVLLDDPILGGPRRDVTLADTERNEAQLALVSGGDVLYGDDGNDRVFGQGGEDTISGGNHDDITVGNQHRDVIHGDAGEDDVVGGSLVAGQRDTGDRLYGDGGADVITGDNAEITRLGETAWTEDAITNGHARDVTLHDVDLSGPDLGAVGGNDLILGGGERDRLFGQSGNDTVKGNDDDDFLQGNQADDLLEGNAGGDDLIGGSRASDRADGDDVIHGGGQADVAIGDNGLIDRVEPAESYYRTYQIGIDQTRWITLLDIDSDSADVSGSDQLSGGEAVDVLFGQADRDYLFGGTEADYLEGNAGSDFAFGDSVRSQVLADQPQQLTAQQPGGLPDLPTGLPELESTEPALSGEGGQPGQDDQIGGSSKAGLRDTGDFLYGEQAQDFQLGDNGQLVRTIESGAYKTYVDYNPDTVYRKVTRYDVNGDASAYGGDYAEGNDGDDYQWGQDGDDELRGGRDNDDQYGELGADKLFGDEGEDAQVGDRGSITNTKLASGPGAQASTQGPTFFEYTGLRPGQLDRRVDLLHDLEGGDLPFNGLDHGSGDELRGGPDHDSMHGGAGDDLMNGDSGGDWLFGADGADVMWGGKGADTGDPNARGEGDSLVDFLFGGASGGDDGTDPAKADILDYRPRGNPLLCDSPQADPCSWFRMTETANDNAADADSLADNQHHGGIDWIYGGDGRDVLQGDVGKNGPDFGDRLLDWNGAFNLYTRCNASYGDDGDVRQHSPAMQSFLFTLAYGSGAGATADEVQQKGTSAYRELSLAYNGEKGNMGPAFPSTPGHFDQNSCAR